MASDSVKTTSFRPDEEEYGPACKLLEERGIEVTAYLRACLRRLNADPNAALASVAAHWPPKRPRGKAAHADRATGP